MIFRILRLFHLKNSQKKKLFGKNPIDLKCAIDFILFEKGIHHFVIIKQ